VSYTSFVVTFTNADGRETVREFATSKQAASYALALADQKISHTVTAREHETFTDWRAQVVNA